VRPLGRRDVVADVRFERKQALQRAEAASWLTALSRGFTHGGDVELPVGGGGTIVLRLPDEVQAEFEVEVDGDEVEIELEFTWKLSASGPDADGQASD
jgi:amphi-Trp domain-containing protein